MMLALDVALVVGVHGGIVVFGWALLRFVGDPAPRPAPVPVEVES